MSLFSTFSCGAEPQTLYLQVEYRLTKRISLCLDREAEDDLLLTEK